MSASRFHKKKRVVEGGSELDLLAAPKRTPSTVPAVAAPSLPRSKPAPSYWSAGAAAARRTREVADELYWASVEASVDDDNGTAATTTMTAAAAAASPPRHVDLLDHVSKVSALPLTGCAVSPALRNMAADSVRLALRGRQQWEQQRRRVFGGSLTQHQQSPGSRASSSFGSRPGTAASVASTLAGGRRPGTAATRAASQSQISRPSTAAAAGTVQQPSSRPTSAAASMFAARVLAATAAPAPMQCRWRDFDKDFNAPVVASREIFEFERRAATAARYKHNAMKAAVRNNNTDADAAAASSSPVRITEIGHCADCPCPCSELPRCDDAQSLEALQQYSSALN